MAQERARTATEEQKEADGSWARRFEVLATRACAIGMAQEEIEAIREERQQNSADREGGTSDEPASGGVRWYDDGGLRRRFEITGCSCDPMNAVFHLDGVFEGAARYRSCAREDWWILRKGEIWRGAGHPRAERCTSILLEGIGSGRVVDGVEEAPDDPDAWTRWSMGTQGDLLEPDRSPVQFEWVSDEHCGYDRFAKRERRH